MDQNLETGLSRVHAVRPRPAYKGEAERWKSIALGLAGLFLLSMAIICYQARDMIASQHTTTIEAR